MAQTETQTKVQVQYKDLLDAGVHFGHLTRKWDPRMAPYIFMERNGIHIIDLNKTLACLDEALNFVRDQVGQGRRIMFVATKKQAKELVADQARRVNMPHVTERWLGGMLTNFQTVRKSIRKMQNIERLLKDEGQAGNIAKRERLTLSRDKEKLERVLSGVVDLKSLPQALFVVDIKREHIAVAEAQKLGIPVIAMVDTNSNPLEVDFPIPANDDAFKSIALITGLITKTIEEAAANRRQTRDQGDESEIAQQQAYMAAQQADAAAAEVDAVSPEAPNETSPEVTGSESVVVAEGGEQA